MNERDRLPHFRLVVDAVNKNSQGSRIFEGAQISLMALSFVQQANLEHMMDTRYQGIVSGIGGADRMAGRIYSCESLLREFDEDQYCLYPGIKVLVIQE